MSYERRSRRAATAGVVGVALLPALLAGILGQSVAAASTSAAPATTSTARPSGSAVAYQGNARHDGFSTDTALTAPLRRAWSRDLGGGPVQYPLIVGSTVFVDVGATNADGSYASGSSVSAYALATGQRRWGPVPLGGTYQFGALAYGSGRLYALNHDGGLVALDPATGAQLWSVRLPGQYSFSAPPTAYAGDVYVSGAGQNGTLYRVNGRTGAVRWKRPMLVGQQSSPAVDATGVYVSFACHQTYGFTLAGVEKWHVQGSCVAGAGRTPALHQGRLYARDVFGEQMGVFGPADGDLLASFVAGPIPAFHDGMMAVLAGEHLQMRDVETGVPAWTNTSAPWTTAPLIVNGYVAMGDNNGRVHLLSESTGQRLWSGIAGTSITRPDLNNANGTPGMAAAQGHLVVPAGSRLTVFTSG